MNQPSAELFVDVVRQLGHQPHVEQWRRAARPAPIVDAELIAHLRQRLCLTADHHDELARFLGPEPQLSADDICTLWWDTR